MKRTVVGIMPPGFDVHDQGVKIWLPSCSIRRSASQPRKSQPLSDWPAQARHHTRPREDRAPDAARRLAGANGANANAQPGQPGACTRRARRATACASTTCRRTWLVASAPRCGCCRSRWCSCCSSPAPTWPTCCSCAPKRGTRSWRSAPHSAPAAGDCMRQFMTEAVVLSVAGGIAGLLLGVLGRAIAHRREHREHSAHRRRWGSTFRVLVFTIVVAVGTGSFSASRRMLHLSSAQCEASRCATAGAAARRGRRGIACVAASSWRRWRWRWCSSSARGCCCEASGI